MEVIMKVLRFFLVLLLVLLLLLLMVGSALAQEGEGDLPSPDELIIEGIVLVPIIVAIIEVAKKLGLPTEYAPWLNGLLSLVGYGLMFLVLKLPETAEPVTLGLNFLITFLGAAGFYNRVLQPINRQLSKS